MINTSYIPGHEAAARMNELGATGTPFLFLYSYDGSQAIVEPLPLATPHIKYQMSEEIDKPSTLLLPPSFFEFTKFPVSYEHYMEGYSRLQPYLANGTIQLVNYTQPTPIKSNLSLSQLYEISKAKYKLLIEDSFLCFSPETFVQIANGVISTSPMKGTIDASLPNAEKILMDNAKELEEHQLCVDLLCTDLRKVASPVWIDRFRYAEPIPAKDKQLLQTSSRICGKLPDDYYWQLGSIIHSMLPAGSILGAPRPQALELLKQAEGYARGFYTGVFGVFNGHSLDSAVLIRYIEQTPAGMVYKSGGGITAQSDPRREYQEMIDKVYVPIY